jgi:hypothetical protein
MNNGDVHAFLSGREVVRVLQHNHLMVWWVSTTGCQHGLPRCSQRGCVRVGRIPGVCVCVMSGGACVAPNSLTLPALAECVRGRLPDVAAGANDINQGHEGVPMRHAHTLALLPRTSSRNGCLVCDGALNVALSHGVCLYVQIRASAPVAPSWAVAIVACIADGILAPRCSCARRHQAVGATVSKNVARPVSAVCCRHSHMSMNVGWGRGACVQLAMALEFLGCARAAARVAADHGAP